MAGFGGNLDAFVAKRNAAGSALLLSTHLGGSGEDAGYAIAVHSSSGMLVVTGSTDSNNFPTVSPYQANRSGSFDLFVAKISDDKRRRGQTISH